MDHTIYLDEVSDILRADCRRRTFLRRLVTGPAAAAFGSMVSMRSAETAIHDPGESTVSFVTGSDRRDMVYQALKPLKRDIRRGIRGKKVIIKPNLVGNEQILSATHPDALRGILDFLKPICKETVYIGESTGRRYYGKSGTFTHYRLYNYTKLENEYNVKLIDLNERPYIVRWVVGREGHPLDIRIIETFLDPNVYFISACRFKIHNCMIATLSAKNMLMGAPLPDGTRHDKGRMHSAGYRNMHFNFFQLAQKIRPQLAVIDGLVGMEGNGPTMGDPVEHGVALAGTDFVSADRIGCYLMGVNFDDVGYLTYCANAGLGQGDMSKIRIIGPDPAPYVKHYRLHERIEEHLMWKY